MTKKGKFIVFEGVDRSGKSTLIEALKKELDNEKFFFTREPGGTNESEQIRKILKKVDNKLDPLSEMLLFVVSRRQHSIKIKELLDKGINVIADRYAYASYVYQGILRGIGLEKVIKVNKEYGNLIEPDLIFYLDIDYQTYLEREEKKDRIEQNNKSFFEVITQGYSIVLPSSKTIKIDSKQPISESIKIILNNINRRKHKI